VNGVIHHKIGQLTPTENEPPKFGQIYFFGPEEQINHRQYVFGFLKSPLLREICTLLYLNNPYVQQFHYASEFISNNPTIDFKIVIRQDENVQKNFDKRRYNKPTVNEVAAIITGEDTDSLNTNREIHIYKKNPSGKPSLQFIKDDHTAYDALHYVLMHFYGEQGWSYKLYKKFIDQNGNQFTTNNHTNLNQDKPINILIDQTNANHNQNSNQRDNDLNNISENQNNFDLEHYSLDSNISDLSNSISSQSNLEDINDMDDHLLNTSSYSTKYVTCCEYYSARLMRFEDSTHHYFGRLYQQYIVDQYLKIETAKLRYIRHNQAKLRVEMYKGLVDAFTKADTNLEDTGQMIVLPSSFNGGPRYMLNLFHDAMAIVKEFGKPDLFITITCNPHWPEIKRELGQFQTAQDIPDIVSRVFKMKLKAILDMILKKHIFGKVNAHMYVIEFQKRGLPHAHLLIILESQDKPKTINDINQIVSSEIPDPISQPQLYKTVTSSMNHGLCGMLNPNAKCMIDGKCSKNYPKCFQDETSTHNDGYPLYRRRDNGATFVDGKNHICDNRHIVPYNPVLSTIFDCHINVEICTSIRAVKYIYKYITKGIYKI